MSKINWRPETPIEALIRERNEQAKEALNWAKQAAENWERSEIALRIIEDAPHAEFCESTLTRGLPCNCFKSEAEALIAQENAG